jgi:hypothetical protein
MKSRIAQSLSLWRLHSLLRAAILNAILMVMRPGKILTRFTEIIRHVCDPPRRRKNQSAAALVT